MVTTGLYFVQGVSDNVRFQAFITTNGQLFLSLFLIQTIAVFRASLCPRALKLNFLYELYKVSKGSKIRNRYNQVPHLSQDTNGKVTDSQLDTTNECQEVSPFPAGDHKAHINRRTQNKHKTEKT